ncbi:hypothetical protein C0Q70_05863 [Pomacea canaliculata]|uniref:Alpha-carbonic anhydrase domain-containing protein n=1 Tax=Pomacea canaliculata TaxID=400727 RepID=A0A2T7PMI2_POMCA|nr:hypothetical protein C0Q70_05863 [Pomacea canaliculata]
MSLAQRTGRLGCCRAAATDGRGDVVVVVVASGGGGLRMAKEWGSELQDRIRSGLPLIRVLAHARASRFGEQEELSTREVENNYIIPQLSRKVMIPVNGRVVKMAACYLCNHPPLCIQGYCNRWADWWDYNGISGPQFWGLMNPGWILCSKGRNQSPIDIDPSSLLFDPSLTPLYIQGDEVRHMGKVLDQRNGVVTLTENRMV